MATKNEGLIKDSLELIIKEIQTFLTISYIAMIGIGMLFNYQKYAEFGINIFQYSDLFDYLVAPFEDFRIILFSVLTVGFTGVLVKFDVWWKRKYPKNYTKVNFGWDKKSWYKQYRIIAFLSIFFLYLHLSASFYGKISKIEINKKEAIQIKYVDNSIKEGVLIGKTSEIIFLKLKEKIIAIPYGSMIKEMEVKE